MASLDELVLGIVAGEARRGPAAGAARHLRQWARMAHNTGHRDEAKRARELAAAVEVELRQRRKVAAAVVRRVVEDGDE